MIIEIALGIVLGVVLLALIPLLIIGTVRLLRFLAPVAVIATIWLLLSSYPSRVIGLTIVCTVAISLIWLWVAFPARLERSNKLAARSLVKTHAVFMGLLDGTPPFRGLRWLPLRVFVLAVAAAVVTALIIMVLGGIAYAWSYAPSG